MTFPATSRKTRVEMLIGTTWTNITSDVRLPIGITRGKANESGQAAPQKATLTLNNAAGKYSPRNPVGPYSGQFGRNTQLRVGIDTDPAYDAYSSSSGTGDLSWTHTPVDTPTGVVVFIWQYNTNSGQLVSVTYGGVTMSRRIFGLFTLGATQMVGYLYFLNTDIPPGPQTVLVDTNAVILRQASAVTVTGGTQCELDVTAFGYSNAAPSANPVIAVPTTSANTLQLNSLFSELDDGSTISAGPGYTELGEHDIGTETVSVERSTNQALPPSSARLATWSAASAHWGIMAAAVRAVYYRMWGEVSEFPPKWDLSLKVAWVPIEVSGILRRLGQGDDPSTTGLRNFIFPAAGLFRYWPLSGAVGTQYSLDIAPVWKSVTGSKFYSEGPGSFKYGESMGSPYLGTGMALFNTDFSPMRGDVATGYANWAIDFVYQSLDLGNLHFTMYDYNGFNWDVHLDGATGIAQVSFTDPDLGPIGFSPTGVLAALLDSNPHHVRLQVTKNGAVDTDWALYIDGVLVDSGFQGGYVAYGMSVFRIQYGRTGAESWVNLAHIAVWADPNTVTWPTAVDTAFAAAGYAGETAGARLARICALEGVPIKITGDPADTTLLGPQYSEALLAQLRDAEAADLGILTEPRDRLGLLYRTRTSQYDQAPDVSLSWSGRQVSPPFEPVDDDQLLRNDVTATRRDGDSIRVIATTGVLSTQDPPNGVGRYKDDVTVNVQTDAMLDGVAAWLLNLGTLDAARYPSVRVDLAAAEVVAAGLERNVMLSDVGDRLAITGLAGINVYEDISLLIVGYAETIGERDHDLVFNCVPGAVFDTAVYGTSASVGADRYDTGGSTLAAAATNSATSLSVATSGTNALWTTDAAAFPFDITIAGERVTVTNITGAASPQTFTVTRSVNGVVKAQLTGADVRLSQTPRYAL